MTIYLENKSCVSKAKILRRYEAIEEDVDAFAYWWRFCDDAVGGWLAVEAADEVGQIVQHGQIVLDNHHIVGCRHKAANCLSSFQALLDIEVGGRFVKHVHVGFLDADHGDGETLQLSTGQIFDVAVKNVGQVCDRNKKMTYFSAMFYNKFKIKMLMINVVL